MRKKINIGIIYLFVLVLLPAFAGDIESILSLSFARVTEVEAERLQMGAPVIRSVKTYKDLGLIPFDNRASVMLDRFSKLKPNYITELFLVRKFSDDAEFTEMLRKLQTALSDVTGFIRIPYWSVKQQTTYDLFDKMEVQSRTPIEGGESIEVIQHMEPFDDFAAVYKYSMLSKALVFSGTNIQPIVYSYKNFKAVAPRDMIWEIYAFQYGNSLCVYGVGGIKAFDLLGVFRDRLEPSFIGRVAAFFKYISSKIE